MNISTELEKPLIDSSDIDNINFKIDDGKSLSIN